MPRPPIRKTRVLAKAQREGEHKADTEHAYKSVKFIADMLPFLPEKYKKNAILWMKSLVEKHLHRIPKAVALIGMTLIVKNVIHTTDSLAAKVAEIAGKHPVLFAVTPFVTVAAQLTAEYFAAGKVKEEDIVPEWAEWLVAFAIAYVIIEHGGQILNFGQQGLAALVGLMLA